MTSSLLSPPMVATSAGLAPLRRSGLTLLLNRVGLNAFHMNGGHVPKPLFKARAVLNPSEFLTSNIFKMPYRRAYKRPRYGKRDKYSVQQKAFQFSAETGQSTTWLLVPATTLEGMRKVKHLMVNLTIDPDAAGPMWWAIVYVPQGTSVGAINVTTSSAATGMYEPNQFVMNCGIADPTAGPIRFGSPIARNLNDGDAIALVVRHTNSAARSVMGTCRYAITLQ